MTITTLDRTAGKAAGSVVAPSGAAAGSAGSAGEGAIGSGIRSGVWGELTAEA